MKKEIKLSLAHFANTLFVILALIAIQVVTLLVPAWSPVLNFTKEDTDELEKLFNKAGEKHKGIVKTEIDAAVNGLCTKDELSAKFEALGLKENVVKELTDAVTKQGEELRKYLNGDHIKTKSLEEILEEKKDDIAGIATGKHQSTKIIIPRKAIEEAMRKTLLQRSAASGSTLGMMLPDIGILDYNNTVMLPLFRQAGVGPNSNGVIRYMDQANITRGADNKAEGAAFAESAIDWIEKTISVQKITDSIPVTKESFNDLEFVRGEVDRLLNLNLALKEDQQLYAGSGVAPQLKGISIYAASAQAAIGAAPFADSVDFANLFDLIACLKMYISTGKKKYIPSHVTLNPADTLRMKLVKDSQGRYVLPPFITADGTVVDGVRVVESNQVTVNTFTIGDFRYATVYGMGGIEIDMGYINDQFVKDITTIKASKREALLVRDVDLGGFAKITDITAALALLETP